MRRFLRSLGLAALLGAAAAGARAQEVLPPTYVGGGGSVTRQTNGQIVELSTTGTLDAVVNFTEISSARVTGVAVRTSGSGTLRIRWVNANREIAIALGPTNPDDPFGMEGGDVDKRGGQVDPD